MLLKIFQTNESTCNCYIVTILFLCILLYVCKVCAPLNFRLDKNKLKNSKITETITAITANEKKNIKRLECISLDDLLSQSEK